MNNEDILITDAVGAKWSKNHTYFCDDDEKAEKYLENIKILLEKFNHICYKKCNNSYSGCCGASYYFVWCENPEMCLLRDSIEKIKESNRILYEKLFYENHKCIEIIETEPKYIKWCNNEKCTRNI